MFCSNCGAQVGDNEKFCSVCGTPEKAQTAAPVTQPAAQPVQAAPQPVQEAPQPAPVYQQPVPQSVPVAYQQSAPQPAPIAYQQPVQPMPQPMPQAVPAPTKEKGGPRRTCFIVGLITCILLILETAPVFLIGAMLFVVGPLAMIFGASNSEDLFGYGILICLSGFLLMAVAIVSIVLNGICTKITKKRPASKCRSLRMVAAIMTLVDSAIVLAPVIGLNDLMSDAEFFYIIFALTFVLAVVFLVLAIITNNKEKKLGSA